MTENMPPPHAHEQAGTDPAASAATVDDREPTEQQPDSPEAIQADIERTREELGHTVEALAAKADIKGRAKQKGEEVKQRATGMAQAVRDKAAPAAQQAGAKAGRLGATARDAVTSGDQSRRSRGAVVVAGGAVAAGAIVVRQIRRRRARQTPATMPERLRARTREVGTTVWDTVSDSDLAAQASERGQEAAAQVAAGARRAAASPSTASRVQGAVVATVLLMLVAWMRRSRAHKGELW
jgi:hypothetical protein